MLNPSCRTNWKVCSLGIVTTLFATLVSQSASAGSMSEPVGYKLSVCENLDVLKKPSDMKTAMMAAVSAPKVTSGIEPS